MRCITKRSFQVFYQAASGLLNRPYKLYVPMVVYKWGSSRSDRSISVVELFELRTLDECREVMMTVESARRSTHFADTHGETQVWLLCLALMFTAGFRTSKFSI